MKKIILIILLIPQYLLAADKIQVGLGSSSLIPLRGAQNVWVENKKVVLAAAAGSSLSLKGVSIGESLVRVGSVSYSVQVIHPSQLDSFQELQKITRHLVGLRIQSERGQVSIKGTLYSLSDWKKIAQKKLRYQMRAEISESLQQQAQNYFHSLLKKEKLPRLNVIFSESAEVRVHPKSNHLSKYINLFSDYGILVNEDPEVLESAPTVKVQITVAEVSKRFIQEYGIKWPDSYHAQVLSGGTFRENDLEFIANAFENNSYGKILASPNIVCRSGKEAEFLAGGEIPIMMRSYKTQEVIWKRYGVLLKVKPLADSSGRMSISIETEVSTLDMGNKVGDVPGILTNRVSSHFDLTKSKTIALSGLIKSEDGNDSAGLPILSRIPILGALFSSKKFQDRQSELVIFVRPVILDEDDDSSKQNHLGDIKWK